MSTRTLSSVSSCKLIDKNYVIIKPFNEYIYCTYRYYKKNYTCKILRVSASISDAQSLIHYLNNPTVLEKLSVNDLFLYPEDEQETIYRVTAISVDTFADIEVKDKCIVITGKILFVNKQPYTESAIRKFRYVPVFKLDRDYIQAMLNYYSFLSKELQKGI